eukprot:531830-Amphidinium_carterae.1
MPKGSNSKGRFPSYAGALSPLRKCLSTHIQEPNWSDYPDKDGKLDKGKLMALRDLVQGLHRLDHSLSFKRIDVW